MSSVNAAVAARYARALAELAGIDRPEALQKTGAELDLLARVFDREAGLGAFFDSPAMSPEQKTAALQTIGTRADLSDLTRRFLAVLVARRRVEALPAIARAFADLADEAAGIVPAETTVAVPLRVDDAAALREAIEKLTGRRVRLSMKVDPEVLGGARTRIGSRVYDGTLRHRLETLRRRMAEAG